jgi:hypothetical protein
MERAAGLGYNLGVPAARVLLHVIDDASQPKTVVHALVRGSRGEAAREPRFEPLHRWAAEHVDLVPLERANLIMYGASAFGSATQLAADAARRVNLTCIFLNTQDAWQPFRATDGVLYRNSLDKRRQRPNERAMPAMVGDQRIDAAALGLDLGDPPYEPTPRVGFCGYVGSPIGRLNALATLRLQKWRGLHLRANALAALRRAEGVDTRFVERTTFGMTPVDAEAGERRRRDLLANMLQNPYTLCMRGKGNFSFRLYEVLAAGRIPMYVDTHTVLPFENELDWPSLMPIVRIDRLEDIGPTLWAFHARFDAATFTAHQRRLWQIWHDWLSPLGFVKQLVRLHGRP